MYHFGVSSKLFEELQFPNSKTEQFYDIYYNTKDFQLARNNLWLRCRSQEDENLPDTWLLKKCIINSMYPETLNIDEWKSSSVISNILDTILKNHKRNTECEDKIIGGYDLIGIALFPTTRIIFDISTDYSIYIDYLSFGNSKTQMLIGSLKFKNPKSIDNYILYLLEETALISSVRSKIIEKINEENTELFKIISENIPKLNYKTSHLFKNRLTMISLP